MADFYRSPQQSALEAYQPYRGPSGMRYSNGYDPQRSPEDFLRALRTEIDAVKVPIRPGFPLEGFDNDHRLLPHSRLKSNERLQSDYQQMQYMDRLLSAYGKPEAPDHTPESWASIDQALPPEEARALKDSLRAYATDADKYRSKLRSRHEDTGFFDYGSPLNTAMNWGQGFASAIYGVGQNVYQGTDWLASKALGIQPQPSRPTNFTQALNTITAPGQYIAEVAGYANPAKDDHSAWSAMESVRRDIDKSDRWDTPERMYAPNDAGASMMDAIRASGRGAELGINPLTDGRTYWESVGLGPNRWYGGAAPWLGAFSDAVLNPYLDAPGIVSASKQLPRIAPIARQLAEEFGFDAAITAATQYNEAQEIRRLKEEAGRD